MQQKDVSKSWQIILSKFYSTQNWKLYVVCCLMLCNWGLEAKKWQLLILSIQPISFRRSLRAVFSGQALALSTPNRIGEFAGRVVYLNDGNKLRALSLSGVGSLAQSIVTCICGAVGLVFVYQILQSSFLEKEYLSIFWVKALLVIMAILIILQLLFYYNLSWITKVFEKIPIVAKYKFFIEKLEELHNKQLTKILAISFLRYVVYVVQYILLYQFFGIEVTIWQIACLVCVQLLIMAIVPSIALAELGVRGKVSIALFSLVSNNTLGVIATAASIWIINLIFPALVGSLLIFGLRIIKK